MTGSWQAIGQFIKDIGFPIFVAVYLLLQVVALAPKIEAMQQSLNQIERSQLRIEWLLRSR